MNIANTADVEHRRPSGRLPQSSIVRVIVIIIGLLAAGCGVSTTPVPSGAAPPRASASGSPVAGEASPPTATVSAPPIRMIEQPPVPADVPVTPDSARVDLEMPTFSNPTKITNPLFPVSNQASVLMLGQVDGMPFRTEVTLLPFTRIVEWDGEHVETAVSQYQAYLDGRITEIAYDLYAQADDGSVWYFGEDVSDFEDGAIVTKEGTWLAGKDAPAAMIMPGVPEVGDVLRTENSPGFAFEEVTVKAVDQVVEGPLGPVPGGLVVTELHMDGATEDKTFAPGYGEFLTTDGADVEALALAVPTDTATGPPPAALTSIKTGADAILAAATSKDWKAASAALDTVTAAWDEYQTRPVPVLIGPRMTSAVQTLGRAVAARNVRRSRQAAIDVAMSSLDLQLRYRPVGEIDLARLDLWAAQVLVDAAAGDGAAVRGDAFTMVFIRDRILEALPKADLIRLNTQLLNLQLAGLDEDLGRRPRPPGSSARSPESGHEPACACLGFELRRRVRRRVDRRRRRPI